MFADKSSGPFSCGRGALGPRGWGERDQSCPALPKEAVSGVSTTGLLEGGVGDIWWVHGGRGGDWCEMPAEGP